MCESGLVVSDAAATGAGRLPDVGEAAERIAAIEAELDPAEPERSGIRVLAYGEISATLMLPRPAVRGGGREADDGLSDAVTAAGYVGLGGGVLPRLGGGRRRCRGHRRGAGVQSGSHAGGVSAAATAVR